MCSLYSHNSVAIKSNIVVMEVVVYLATTLIHKASASAHTTSMYIYGAESKRNLSAICIAGVETSIH